MNLSLRRSTSALLASSLLLTIGVLTNLPPSSLFIILALVIIAAWVLMLKGIRARPWRQPALC
ncbi:hypothetical protein IM060_004246 [Escherichia coli]|nr:hypothetical protein [Escherichia coli]EED0762038.1 hypothetical protein [Escherichia coli]EED1640133.1 hypothetical protein [Escherichia coli]EEQ5354247.1 hypothetical protein [Escherichia coli]EEQ5362325.1 hypothetical protein [Escherichia coli]